MDPGAKQAGARAGVVANEVAGAIETAAGTVMASAVEMAVAIEMEIAVEAGNRPPLDKIDRSLVEPKVRKHRKASQSYGRTSLRSAP